MNLSMYLNPTERNHKINYDLLAEHDPAVSHLIAENARLKTKLELAYKTAAGEGFVDVIKKAGRAVWEFIKKIIKKIIEGVMWVINLLKQLAQKILNVFKFKRKGQKMEQKKIEIEIIPFVVTRNITSKVERVMKNLPLTVKNGIKEIKNSLQDDNYVPSEKYISTVKQQNDSLNKSVSEMGRKKHFVSYSKKHDDIYIIEDGAEKGSLFNNGWLDLFYQMDSKKWSKELEALKPDLNSFNKVLDKVNPDNAKISDELKSTLNMVVQNTVLISKTFVEMCNVMDKISNAFDELTGQKEGDR